jgi:anti-sigma regulatory factor (Ser/Thr protein kinase)
MSVQQFEVSNHAPSRARRFAAETLRAWGLALLVETTELLVSELVTNGCRASASGEGGRPVVALRLTATSADLIVEVWDGNDAAPVRQEPGHDAEGGRGLLLVAALGTRWAFYRPRTGGKVMWCSLPLPGTADAVARPGEALPVRTAPSAVAVEPVEVFDDLAVLQRVADGLRALDWELPRGDGRRS